MDRPYLHLPSQRPRLPNRPPHRYQWDNTIIRYASYSRKPDAWIDERQRERPIIIGDIPTAFKRAIDAPAPPFKDGDIVLAIDKASHTERYAGYKASTDGGPDTLAELWTDTTGYPHETGKTLRIADQKDITHVALWTGINKHYKSNPLQATMTRRRKSAPRSSAQSRAPSLSATDGTPSTRQYAK